jgi:hypothetical protein
MIGDVDAMQRRLVWQRPAHPGASLLGRGGKCEREKFDLFDLPRHRLL